MNAPDFEAQRLELKMKKAQKASSNGDLSSKSLQQQQQPSASNNHGNAPKPPPVAPTQAPAKPVIDFFSSLDDEIGAFAAAPQNNMDVFNNIGTSAGFWAAGQQQQQAQSNPFGIMSHPQQQQFNNGGYIQPNYTGGNMNNNNSSNPFGMHHQQNQQIQQQFANRGGGSVSQQNNPFRASAPVMSLQNTGTAVGFNSFSSNNNQFTVENVFGNSGSVSPPPVNGNNTGITGIEAGDPAATFQQQSSSASLTSGPGNFATMDRIGTNTTGQMNGFGGGVGGGGGNFATFGRSSPTAPDFASLRSHATGSTNSSNSPFGAYVDPFAATSQFSSQINPAAPRSLNVGQSPSYPVSTGGKGNNNGLLFNPSSANNNNFAFTSSNNNINNNNNAFSPPTSPLVNANNYDNNNHFGSNFGGSMQPSSQASKLSPPLGNTTKSVNMGAPFNNNNNNLNIANYLPTTNGISSLKNQDVFATLNPLSSNAGQPSVTSGMSLNTLAAYNQQQLYSTPINNSGMTAYGGNAVNSPFGNNPGVNPFMMQNKMGAGGVDSNNPFGKSNVNNNQSNTFF